MPRCHPPSLHQVFVKDGQLYGFKGLAGKLGPIGVHASMLLCMAGFAMGAREHFACVGWWWRGRSRLLVPQGSQAVPGHSTLSAALTSSTARPSRPSPTCPHPAVGGWNGTTMIPEGGEVVVASALRSASPLAWAPAGAEAVLHCDDFRIDYRPDGSVRQFYSDIQGGRAAGAEGGALGLP